MKKLLVLLSILIISVLSGCIQAETPTDGTGQIESIDVPSADIECDAIIKCQTDYDCISMPGQGPICVTAEVAKDPCASYTCPEGTECGVAESYPPQVICSDSSMPEEEATKTVEHAIEFEDWCDPTEINVFVNEYLPINKVHQFVDKNYDMEFGPTEIEKLFVGDNVFGYLSMPLSTDMKYYNFEVQGRFVNGNTIEYGEIYTDADLMKYGDYYYQYWEEFNVVENTNVTFEIKLTYDTSDRSQTQCEKYDVGVSEFGGADVSDLIDLKDIEYSRSRVFFLAGNFTEDLYDDLNRDFRATFLTEHSTKDEYVVEVPLKNINKVVCVSDSCSFFSEVNLPRDYLGNYTLADQWCGDEFTPRLRIDRGTSQPFYSDFSSGLMKNMCNKLRTGLG